MKMKMMKMRTKMKWAENNPRTEIGNEPQQNAEETELDKAPLGLGIPNEPEGATNHSNTETHDEDKEIPTHINEDAEERAPTNDNINLEQEMDNTYGPHHERHNHDWGNHGTTGTSTQSSKVLLQHNTSLTKGEKSSETPMWKLFWMNSRSYMTGRSCNQKGKMTWPANNTVMCYDI
jgi:hypothetical protein